MPQLNIIGNVLDDMAEVTLICDCFNNCGEDQISGVGTVVSISRIHLKGKSRR